MLLTRPSLIGESIRLPFFFSSYYYYFANTQPNRIMGALSNSGRKSANLVGFYKGLQSAGAAVAWSTDLNEVSYMGMFASNWALLPASILIATPLVLYRIKDSVSVEEDLKFSDETKEDVLAVPHAEDKSTV